MKNGAIICNSGHFNVETGSGNAGQDGDVEARSDARLWRSTSCETASKVFVLGEGRLINLAAAEGHPASVMDMSFANQALSVEYMVANYKTLDKKVYAVPEELDRKVAAMKLDAMGVKIDVLTP